MTKVRAVGNALNETYASVAEYVKANPDFVNTETDAPPTEEEVKAGKVMTTHTTGARAIRLRRSRRVLVVATGRPVVLPSSVGVEARHPWMPLA
jgi:hypothetical protein